MNRIVAVWLLGAVAGVVGLFANGQEKPAYPFVFRDVGEEAGLFPHLAGIMGHGAAWGDVDGDGWLDLYIGTFHQQESKPNLFLRNRQAKFTLDGQEHLRLSNRATGCVFADLDNDGDLDLYIGSMPQPKRGLRGCALFRNDGGGKFTDVSANNAACPEAFGGRSVAVLDFDGDGRLDLLVGEDPLPGYNGSKTRSTRLFRNRGNLQFEDATQAVGIPAGIPGLGVAAADFNNDTWPDLFICSNSGGNRLFINDGKGKFREADNKVFLAAWEGAGGAGGDNMICGVCAGDVNRDGLLDIVLGPHYSTPWRNPIAARLYLNRGSKDGLPRFDDVTDAAGLLPLPMKAPHVEIQDFDNDGWPEIYVSQVKFADGKPYPVIFQHLGLNDGLPRFRTGALAVNDFPTAADQAVKKTGEFFDKMIKDRKIIYMAPGPSADFDNDGKLDLFLPNWWIESRSLLLRNETPSGNWLQVQLAGGGPQPTDGINPMGIGTRINVYPAGKLGDASARIASREMAVGFGYASGQPAIAHFGLRNLDAVDLELVLPHSKGVVTHKGVKANQRVTLTLQ
jgi:hypothetical protein